uniref:C2 domain-containing protein n=1 Tax=Macrostomum lignano TaxID=282301 RepID=A0A1I8FGU1_9PLAT
DERLALHVLNCLPLVKEHVETRPLYSPLQPPGIEQGKLQCWVDIFPCLAGTLPQPTDVRPREPRNTNCESSCGNTKDGWLAGLDEKQETDVHYAAASTGFGNFNWRFKFPMDYLPAEKCHGGEEEGAFWSLDATEQCIPPNLVVQIWDNDKFSADDFAWHLGAQLVQHAGAEEEVADTRAYGYWPCINDEKPDGEETQTGKVEMELELLTVEEAQLRPAGFGQDEPNEKPASGAAQVELQ